MASQRLSSNMAFVCILGTGSDGSLCITELEAVLQSVQLEKSDIMLSITCRRIQKLQPLHTGPDNDRVLNFSNVQ